MYKIRAFPERGRARICALYTDKNKTAATSRAMQTATHFLQHGMQLTLCQIFETAS